MAAITARELELQMPDASKLLSDEPEMESSLHYMQLLLLVTCLEWAWQERDDFFIGANLSIYFSRQQLKNRDFRGPDFFLVKDTTRLPRNSWVVWEEDGRYPDLIIELLSNSTANVDRTIKRDLYAERFHTPEYFYFSPDTLEFAGFRLDINKYQPITPNVQGWLWSETLGFYLGIHERQLRYFSLEGALLPTPQESAKNEIVKAKQATQAANQAIEVATQASNQAIKVAKQASNQAEEVAEQATQAAEQATQAANQAIEVAEQERQIAKQAKAELHELQDKMRSLGIDID